MRLTEATYVIRYGTIELGEAHDEEIGRGWCKILNADLERRGKEPKYTLHERITTSTTEERPLDPLE